MGRLESPMESGGYSQSEGVHLKSVAYGRTLTFSYLFKQNIGPDRECAFCERERETDEHTLWRCFKSRVSWKIIERYANVNIDEIDHFTCADWITKRWRTRCSNNCFKVVMASCAWLLWNARCDLIFNQTTPDFLKIGYQAVNMVECLTSVIQQTSGKLSYSTFHAFLSLFTNAVWIEQNRCYGMGFVLIDGNKTILLVGAR